MQVAWVRVAEIAPGMIVGLSAGVAADQWSRRHIMGLTDTARAVLIGLIPVLFFLHDLTLGIIIGLVVLLSVAEIVFDSSYDAYLPTLVPPGELMNANAKLSAMGSVAEVTGFGVAGVLFEWLGGAPNGFLFFVFLCFFTATPSPA
jgi:MFS-type transporter involved in bile tolerance (Atg22 family)